MLLKKQEAISQSKKIKVVMDPDEYSDGSVGYHVFIYDLNSSSDKCIRDEQYFKDELDDFYFSLTARFGIKKEDFYPIIEN